MVIAFTMIERERLAMTWRSGSNSKIVLAGTLAATLFMPLETAVFAGVMLSIVILLRITGKPDLTQLVQHPESGFEEVPFNRAAPAPVAIINLEGDLYFAAAEDLDYELLQALKPETRVVVLRMKRLRAVGSSAMAMLEHFHKLLKSRGIQLIVCGVEEEMMKILTGSGVRRILGEQNIFYADNRIFQSTGLARTLESRLFDSIEKIARQDSVNIRQDTPLVEAFIRAARHSFRPMPVSDPHDRLAGVFDEMAMLRGLTLLLQAKQALEEGASRPTPEVAQQENIPLTL